MEIIVYLLAVLLTALAVAVILLVYKIGREKKRSESLSALINASNVYTVTWTTDFSLIEANKPLAELLEASGRKADESFLRSLFLDNDSMGTTGSVLLMGAMAKNGRETVFNLPDGTVKHILWKSKAIKTGQVFTTVATTGIDITGEYAIMEELDAARQEKTIASDSLDIAAESADIGLLTITHTASGYELNISANGIDMLGMTSDEADFDGFVSRISINDRTQFCDIVHKLLSGGSVSEIIEINVRISENTSHHFIFRMKGTNSVADNINRITAAFVDATGERKNLGIRTGSPVEDPLTGFLDRNGFFSAGEAYLEKASKENRPAVMICIKIRRYQKISTLFGMEVADRLLLTYSKGLESCGGKPTLFGRLNLDSFAVLMPYGNKKETDIFLKNLRIFIENACNDTILPSILTEQSGFDAGACFYEESDDVMGIYNKANIMLLADYAEGERNCRYFDKEVEEKIYSRETIEEELRKAIKNGEFELYYQPKVTFGSKDIKGAEALMRWRHPSNGLTAPMSFIPIAEEVGLITFIDEWGMREACRQAKLWQDKGYVPIRVSVNMSQAQLYQTDIVSSIKYSLEAAKLDAKYLEVELTETIAMQDIERTISILKEIKALGVSISMDDFGTGYSSLSALKLLPIDILKIDRSLICDLGTSSASYSIVKAIVDLGRALDLEVLAEGVETQEQSEVLHELGCTVAQGYFFGRPLTAADMERLFLKKITKE